MPIFINKLTSPYLVLMTTINYSIIVSELIGYAVIYFVLAPSYRYFFHISMLSWVVFKLYRSGQAVKSNIYLVVTLLMLIATLLYDGKRIKDTINEINVIGLNSIAISSTVNSPSLSQYHDKTIEICFNVSDDLVKALFVVIWKQWTCHKNIQQCDSPKAKPQIRSNPAKNIRLKPSNKCRAVITKLDDVIDEWRSDEEYDACDKVRRLSPLYPSPMLMEALHDARRDVLLREDQAYNRITRKSGNKK